VKGRGIKSPLMELASAGVRSLKATVFWLRLISHLVEYVGI